MKKTKLTRLIAVFLSLMMLYSVIGAGDFTVSAAEEGDDETASSTVSYDIADVQDLLNAESYADYAERNADIPRGTSTITINAVDYNAELTDADVEVVNNYNGSTGSALLTPNTGSVVWDVEIPKTGKYAIDIEYSFPTDGKSTAIERKLRIDGEYPFKGIRYLSFTKVWQDQFETDENGNDAYKTDINGNDIKAQKQIVPTWRTYTLSDSTGYDIDPYEVVFVKVLDIGTGPGFFAILLAEAGFQVTAVDYTEEMLREARKNAGNLADRIQWLRMDAQALEFQDETFDAAVTRNLTWNLQQPEKAYREWIRVLKKGGTLLNYDANWYQHLFDEKKREEYEADRKRVEELQMEDHYTCTDIDAMEDIARKVPLSRRQRPRWDLEVLRDLGCSDVQTQHNVWEEVWSDVEKANYHSTPMFLVQVRK